MSHRTVDLLCSAAACRQRRESRPKNGFLGVPGAERCTSDPGDPSGGGRGGERDGDLLGRPARDAALHPRVRVRQVHRVAPVPNRHRHRPRRPRQRRRRLGGDRGSRYCRRRRKQQQRQRALTHRCGPVMCVLPRRRVGGAERDYGTGREFKEFIGNGNGWTEERRGEDGRRCRGGGPRPPQICQGPPTARGGEKRPVVNVVLPTWRTPPPKVGCRTAKRGRCSRAFEFFFLRKALLVHPKTIKFSRFFIISFIILNLTTHV